MYGMSPEGKCDGQGEEDCQINPIMQGAD